MNGRAITVSQLNRYVKSLLERDASLTRALVTGEISGFKRHPSGHLYFILKDEEAQVSCVMFKGQAQTLRFVPENGMQVVLRARASLFERSGGFQLYISEMNVVGVGDLHAAFEQLKAQLAKEGLFDPARKKPLPVLPRRIGVITSSSGAVIRDILHVLSRRFPDFRVILHPVPVQGPGAAQAIAAAIRTMNQFEVADVLIVGRGGGSIEDLWAFNEEVVARAVYASGIPVISAVGHETDYTICDFVADVRAPTPSAAAEIVMPIKSELVEKLASLENRLRTRVFQRLDLSRERMKKIADARVLVDPLEMINRRQMRVDLLTQRMTTVIRQKMSVVTRRFSLTAGKLDALSPLKVLSRGYGLVQDAESGLSVLSIHRTAVGKRLDVVLSDGSLECLVERIHQRSEEENTHGV